MKEIGTLYTTEGQVLKVYPANRKKFSLKELQKFVEGYIEIVPGTGKRGQPTAYCNEEGLLKSMPWNGTASLVFDQKLVGPVIQVKREK